jgi:hypothetical protein
LFYNPVQIAERKANTLLISILLVVPIIYSPLCIADSSIQQPIDDEHVLSIKNSSGTRG